MKDNILNILGVAYKEDVISNLLVELINSSTIFQEKIFSMIGLNYEKDSTITAKSRIGVANYGIPDIVVKLESENRATLLIIENKLRAEEGDEQTARYSEQSCIDQIIDIMNFKSKPDFVGVFLTLVKEIPTGDKFINITYESILKECNVQLENTILNLLYGNLLDNLKDFYKDLDITESDKILEVLSEEMESQKLYIKYRNIIEGIKLPDDMEVYIGKAGGKGRVSFITQISKPSWVGEMAKENGDILYCLDEDTYNIHLEGSFDIFNKKISLALHYETNPYVPKDKLLNNTTPEGYKAYEEKREKIKAIVHKRIKELDDKNLKIYNGSNQIASINIALSENSTVDNFMVELLKSVDVISKIVDEAIATV